MVLFFFLAKNFSSNEKLLPPFQFSSNDMIMEPSLLPNYVAWLEKAGKIKMRVSRLRILCIEIYRTIAA